ncbi:DUF2865 domain-containing protein [Methylobacterium dankookense]|uniref:DUF2865 domain-containing protein n=2 Tax=Methylobacterium dankookense TaxID=560405 RepID=A0A564G7B0_9HYPH|nr:DUF2865 domain-containing protein [Methylobacterium dankookense]VUF15421.1 hypothetical protein MTDSW087_05161 [Methylobacterium dankookense]
MLPMRPLFRRIACTLAVVAAAWSVPAPAQEPAPAAAPAPVSAPHPSCPRYRAELASLSDGASVTRALQSEIGRLEAYYRSLNCEGGKFLFFDTRPPQCGAVEQRIRALNATYGGTASEDNSARRRQLQAFIASNCGPGQSGAPGEQHARGGAQVICVRTCDGGYFPMKNLPEGRGGADEMCQALCPGTEAVAYSMPNGDDALRQAATVKGSKAYASLANAFKFQKSFVPNCSCKPADKSWAQALVKAESMMVRHKGDIFVTPMQAEALSRPKVRLTLVGRADKTAAEIAADAAGRAAGTDPKVDLKADPAAMTASTDGATPVTDRANVRIIAPDRIAVPRREAP